MNMSRAESGNTVKVHYTGKLADGAVFDTSMDREPLEFALGEKQVIPGFENAVIGRRKLLRSPQKTPMALTGQILLSTLIKNRSRPISLRNPVSSSSSASRMAR